MIFSPCHARFVLSRCLVVSLMLGILACGDKSGAPTPSEPNEVKKARLGELTKEAFDIMDRVEKNPALRQDPQIQKKMQDLGKEAEGLAKELTGGDPVKEAALGDEIVKKYAPEHYEKFRQVLEDARKAQSIGRMHNIQTAVDQYRLQRGKLPTQEEGLNVLVKPSGNELAYLTGEDEIKDAWGHPIVYTVTNDGQFTLKSAGPDGKNGTADDIPFKK